MLVGGITKIAVCEDEAVYSERLCNAVSEYFGDHGVVSQISVFTDGAPLISEIKQGEKYDLAFLDIQLENSDGMSVAAEIRNTDKNVALVFVTGIESRAVEGYSVSAFDYIVKSSLTDRLGAVLDRFMNSRDNVFLSVQTLSGDTEVIPFSDILFIESEGRGSKLKTSDGICVSSALSIGKISDMLPKDKFIEIHKSVYVQTFKIKRIGTDTVEISNGETLPLSRRKRKQVLSAVMQAVKGGGI